jgi:hypothetical protein
MIRLKLIGKPRDAEYLTPGKIYQAEPSGVDASALITDDDGECIQINLLSCPHARPAKWEEV